MLFAFGISIEDLYDNCGLNYLHQIFKDFLLKYDADLFDKYNKNKELESDVLIEMSIALEKFLCILFFIDRSSLNKEEKKFQKFFEFNESFIKKRAALCNDQKEANSFSKDFEKNFSSDEDFIDFVEDLMEDESKNLSTIKEAELYALHRVTNDEDRKILFTIPNKIDSDNFFDYEKENGLIFLKQHLSSRKGFSLSDNGFSNKEVAYYNSRYCLHCHKRKKDSCSTGLNSLQLAKIKNHIGTGGCPLRQKISESNFLYSIGKYIAALAVIMIDNPLCCCTGYRICIDCSKSCIFQKQEPVDVPLIESNLLEIILDLDYGFEIYSLLSRWNPLKINDKLPFKDSGKKILIVGLGPSGYTLAHYLLNEGHCVIAIDGLRIGNISKEISGIDEFGKKSKFRAIKNFKKDCFEDLGERKILGLGGVAEYGITSRWDKNNLIIIYLLLSRRKNFNLFGSIRFGGNITLSDAFNIGFDHVCLAIGGNLPKLDFGINASFINGVMFASDFLMNLHMNTPYRQNSLSNMHIQSPIVIIGGGLTAVDAATEVIAYYFAQIEKFSKKYNTINSNKIERDFFFNEYDFLNAKKFLKDFENLKKLRLAGLKDSQIAIKMNISTIIYRNKINDCSAYKNNYKELFSAFSEGVKFIENAEVINFSKKENSIELELIICGEKRKMIAGCVLLATGSDKDSEFLKEILQLDSTDKISFYDHQKKYFDKKKSDGPIFLTKDLSVSCFGDMDFRYAGSVVKAMASAKYGYKYITKIANSNAFLNSKNFIKNVSNLFISIVDKVLHYSDRGSIIIVKSYFAAKNFKEGSFYKLQRFGEQCEGIAVSCYKIDLDRLFFAIEERGLSSKKIKSINSGERIFLMGPLGESKKNFIGKNIVLIGGGVGNAALISVGNKFKLDNCKVIHFASFRKKEDCFDIESISNASHLTIWSSDCGGSIDKIRSNDLSFSLKLFDSIKYYSNLKKNNLSDYGKDSENLFNLEETDLIFLSGSSSMMGAFKDEFKKNFLKIFGKKCKIIASVNAPMHCTLGVCGRCICEKSDGERFFSCRNHCYDIFDINMNLVNQRLNYNSLQELIFYKK